MALTRLVIASLRNIEAATLMLSPGINLISGDNGSGKTSLLEAAHVLGLGRSFRVSRHRRLIHDSHQALTVFGETEHHRLGVEKTASGDTAIRIDGTPATSVAALAQKLPLQLFDPLSLDVLTGPSQARRQLLDWGVFHVEHGFQPVWQRNHRALKQRNSLLKSARISPIELSAWEQELAETAKDIERMRRTFFDAWTPFLFPALQRFLPDFDIQMDWHPGWDVEQDLLQLLHANRAKDAERGFTQQGPHRGDLRGRVQGEVLDDRLSRGQIKLAAFAVKLSLAGLLMSKGIRPTLLVDDLASELDAAARRRACEALSALGTQVLLTSIEPAQVLTNWNTPEPVRTFHVEHGAVRLMSE